MKTNEFKNLVIIEDFPNIRQTFDYDCGPSSIQMIALYTGKEIRKDILIKESDQYKDIEKVGIEPEEIISVFKKHKIDCELTINTTIQDLKDNIDKKFPTILMIQAYSEKENPNYKAEKKSGHFVTAIGYCDDKIIFADSSSFNHTYLTDKELLDRWHDVDKFNHLYYNMGIVVKVKRKYNPKKIVHMV
jgi:predicted double-glycine peptidase